MVGRLMRKSHLFSAIVVVFVAFSLLQAAPSFADNQDGELASNLIESSENDSSGETASPIKLSLADSGSNIGPLGEADYAGAAITLKPVISIDDYEERAFAIFAVICSSDNRIVLPGAWAKNTKGQRYRNPDGAYPLSCWQEIDGERYYFGTDGYMQIGWLKDAGKWYYLKSDGKMARSEWVKVGGSWYHFADDGAMQTGWLYSGKVWYWLQDSGAMATGWHYFDGQWRRFDGNGHWRPSLDRSVLISAIDDTASSKSVVVSGGAVNEGTLAILQDDIEAFNEKGQSVGFVLIDLTTGFTISCNAWKSYYAASSIKGSYVCAISSEQSSAAANYKTSIKNAISWSSNDDYLTLRNAFGGVPMDAYMDEVKVSSFSPYKAWPSMCAADQAKLWVRNYEVLSEGAGNSVWLQPYFCQTKLSYIDAALGDCRNVYSKSGWILDEENDHVWNDAGFVEKGSHPYVIAVMSTADKSSETLLQDLISHLDQAHTEMVG